MGSFTIPSDFVSLISVEAIGGGGSGAAVGSSGTFTGGGAGGAYAKSTSISGLSSGQTVYVNIGSGGATVTWNTPASFANGNPGGDTWFNTSNSAPSSSTSGVLAKGGGAGLASSSQALGGQAASCVGDIAYSGGNGPSVGSPPNYCGAGGGAAGPGGAGGAGGYATVAGYNGQGAGGGGSGATLTLPGTIGGTGGTGFAGAGGASTGQTGGAGATTSSDATVGVNGGGGGGGYAYDSVPSREQGQNGGSGSFWTQTSNSATAGSGGGGGGSCQNISNSSAAGNGGLYGAGGSAYNGYIFLGAITGSGAQGIIVFTYATSIVLSEIHASGQTGTVGTTGGDNVYQAITSTSLDAITGFVSPDTNRIVSGTFASGITGIATRGANLSGVATFGGIGILGASVFTPRTTATGLAGTVTPTSVPYTFSTYDRIQEFVTGTNGTNTLNISGSVVQGFAAFFSGTQIIKTVFFTNTSATTTFTIPNDFLSLVSVEAIGGGGSGAVVGFAPATGGGAGGAYAKSTSVSLSIGQTVYVSVGAGGLVSSSFPNNGNPGGDSWFNTSNSAPTSSTTGVLAKGGGGGLYSTTVTAQGGQASTSVGSVTYSGGNGPAVAGSYPNPSYSGGGGGGAAGPGGAGGSGGYSTVAQGQFYQQGGGGGGSGATLTLPGTAGQNISAVGSSGGAGGASTGQIGGAGATASSNSTAGANGGGGGGGWSANNSPYSSTQKGSDGGAGTFWVQTSNSVTAGSGGGGGGFNASNYFPAYTQEGGSGGLYGGGGAASSDSGFQALGALGAQGIVVFSYSSLATYQLYYTVTDGTNWETGLAGYSGTPGSGTITLLRVMASSNGGASITKTVGMYVYITYAAMTTTIIDNAYNCLIPFGPTNARVGVNNIALASSMSS